MVITIGLYAQESKKEFIKRCRNTPLNILLKDSITWARMAKDTILIITEAEYKSYELYRNRIKTEDERKGVKINLDISDTNYWSEWEKAYKELEQKINDRIKLSFEQIFKEQKRLKPLFKDRIVGDFTLVEYSRNNKIKSLVIEEYGECWKLEIDKEIKFKKFYGYWKKLKGMKISEQIESTKSVPDYDGPCF
jgi:hypothetical protein